MSLTTTAMPASVLCIADLDGRQIRVLLDLASGMNERPGQWRKTLRAQSIACYFAKPSARSAVWEQAANQRPIEEALLLALTTAASERAS